MQHADALLGCMSIAVAFRCCIGQAISSSSVQLQHLTIDRHCAALPMTKLSNQYQLVGEKERRQHSNLQMQCHLPPSTCSMRVLI